MNEKELNTQCLGMFGGEKKYASYESSVRVISLVFVGIFFLFSNLMTAAEAAERPTMRSMQEMVLPQFGRGRTFVRIAVIVSVRRVTRDQPKDTHGEALGPEIIGSII